MIKINTKLVFSITLSVILSFFTIFVIYLRKNIFDYLIQKDNRIFKALLILFVSMIFLEIFKLILKLNNARIIKELNLNLSSNISKKICNLPYKEFSDASSYISWYTNDLPLVSSYIFQNYIEVFNQVLFTIFSIGFLCYINYILAITSILFLIILYFTGKIFGDKIGKCYQRYAIMLQEYNSTISNFLEGLNILSYFNRKDFYKQMVYKEQDKIETQMYNIKCLTAFSDLSFAGTKGFLELVMFIVTIYLIYINKISAGNVLVTPFILSTFLDAGMKLADIYVQIKFSKDLKSKLEKYEKNKLILYPNMKHKIEIKDVSFKYGEKEILKKCNMLFEKNKKYAIVGKSGSGKSTILKLILGILKPTEGYIYVDDQILDNKRDLDFSKEISYVSQEVYMFNLSIRENLTLGYEYTEDSIEKALKEAKVYENICTKNDKLESNCNELSGGEKQRISLARALLRNTNTIILDEATSAVDKKTSKEIEDILLSKEDKTVIVISHHLDEEDSRKFDMIIKI